MKNILSSLTLKLSAATFIVLTIFFLSAPQANAAWYDWVLDFFKGSNTRASAMSPYCAQGNGYQYVQHADAQNNDPAVSNTSKYLYNLVSNKPQAVSIDTRQGNLTLAYPLFESDPALDRETITTDPKDIVVQFGAEGYPYVSSLIFYDADTLIDSNNNPLDNNPHYPSTQITVVYNDGTPTKVVYPVLGAGDRQILGYPITPGYVRSITIRAGYHAPTDNSRDSSWVGALCGTIPNTPTKPQSTPTKAPPTATVTKAPNTVCIGDYVFEDVNRNGYKNLSQGDKLIPGVQVQLLETSQIDTTDATGRYSFCNLTAGKSYTVRVLKSNFNQGGPLYQYNLTTKIGNPDATKCPDPANAATCITEYSTGDIINPLTTPETQTVATTVNQNNLGFDFGFWKIVPTATPSVTKVPPTVPPPTLPPALSCNSLAFNATQIAPNTSYTATVGFAGGVPSAKYDVRVAATNAVTGAALGSWTVTGASGSPVSTPFSLTGTLPASILLTASVRNGTTGAFLTSQNCQKTVTVVSTPTKVPTVPPPTVPPPTITKVPTLSCGALNFPANTTQIVPGSTYQASVAFTGGNPALKYDTQIIATNTATGALIKSWSITGSAGSPATHAINLTSPLPASVKFTASVRNGATGNFVTSANCQKTFTVYSTPTLTQVPTLSCSTLTINTTQIVPGSTYQASVAFTGGNPALKYDAQFVATDAVNTTAPVLKTWSVTGSAASPITSTFSMTSPIPASIKVKASIRNGSTGVLITSPTCEKILTVQPTVTNTSTPTPTITSSPTPTPTLPIIINTCPGDPSGFTECRDVDTIPEIIACRSKVLSYKTSKGDAGAPPNPAQEGDGRNVLSYDPSWYAWSRAGKAQMSFCTACGTGPTTPVCISTNGTINMQAELMTLAAPMQSQGNVIVQPVSTNQSTPRRGLNGVAERTFTVQTEGYYKMHMKINTLNGQSNSVYVNVDTDPVSTNLWNMEVTNGVSKNSYVTWYNGTSYTTPKFFFKAGTTHKIVIFGREAGAQIDEITLQYQ